MLDGEIAALLDGTGLEAEVPDAEVSEYLREPAPDRGRSLERRLRRREEDAFRCKKTHGGFNISRVNRGDVLFACPIDGLLERRRSVWHARVLRERAKDVDIASRGRRHQLRHLRR